MALARMRTVRQAYKTIHDQDPESCISLGWLYRQIQAGVIPHITAGNRKLIDLARLEQLLSNPPFDPPDASKDDDIFQRPRIQKVRL